MGPELGRGVFQAGCWLILSLGGSEKMSPFRLQMTGGSLKTQMGASGLHSTLFHAQCSISPRESKSKSYTWLLCNSENCPPSSSGLGVGGLVGWLVCLL